MPKIEYTEERCLRRAPQEPDRVNNGDWPLFVPSTPHVPDKFASWAEWPTKSGRTVTTTETHQTREIAQAVCDRLERKGFEGKGKDFPIRTWVEEISQNTTISEK